MKKNYWYDKAKYQNILRVVGILIWIILGIWGILDSLLISNKIQTHLIILPVNMIALGLVRWYLQKKPRSNSRQERQLLTFFALLIISFTALWIYEI